MFRTILRGARSVLGGHSRYNSANLQIDCQGQLASNLIRNALASDSPCMITRFGRVEMDAILSYLDVTDSSSQIVKSLKYILGNIGPFWWDQRILSAMTNNAGFFPSDKSHLAMFAEKMLVDIRNIDILGSCVCGEHRLSRYYSTAKIIPLRDLEPYYHRDPWTTVLTGKKVLIIHPFVDSIKMQYLKREMLFKNPHILPEFELLTLKAVQSIAGTKVEFNHWFEALEWMCKKIDEIDFEIAIIGAGAYGLPLASYIKSIGRKSIQTGGATQILFGIKGKRWDDRPFFKQLYNKHWIRPSSSDIPENYQLVEYGCYW